jgi:molybdate transport system substrate-binding protein
MTTRKSTERVLVTGASSGIGEALARRFARAGHDLVLVARSADKLNALAEELRSTNGIAATCIACDLAKPGEVAKLAATLERRRLAIDILVNNAGVNHPGHFAKLSRSAHQDIVGEQGLPAVAVRVGVRGVEGKRGDGDRAVPRHDPGAGCAGDGESVHTCRTVREHGRMAMAGMVRVGLLAGLVAAALGFGTGAVHAAEVKVMAANALKEAYVELVAEFERTSGHKVTTTWGGTEGIARRVGDGEVVDVVLIAAPNIDKLILAGTLAAGSRADFARSGVGVAVRSGLPKPDISSGEAVRKAVLAAGSIAYSSGPSGFYLADLFRKMGIADQIKDKVRQPASGVQVGELLARGEADLGFQQVSELMHAKGVDFLGPLPADIQSTTVYAAGLHAAAPAPDAARALVKFLTAPEAGSALRKIGMEPG